MLSWPILLTAMAALSLLAQTNQSDATAIYLQLRSAERLEADGKIAEAEQVTRNIYNRLNPDSVDAGAVLNRLAWLYQIHDRQKDAERTYWKAIHILLKSGSAGSNEAAVAKLNLAAFLTDTGRVKKAERLGVAELLQRTEDPEVRLQARATLADMAVHKGKLKEAERLYLENLRYFQSSPRYQASLEMATLLNNLGTLASRAGDFEIAASRLEEAIQIWHRILGPSHPNLIRSVYNLSDAYLRSHRYERAIEPLIEADRYASEVFGEGNRLTVQIKLDLAEALRKSGRKAEAKEMKQAAVKAQGQMSQEDRWKVDVSELMSLKDRQR